MFDSKIKYSLCAVILCITMLPFAQANMIAAYKAYENKDYQNAIALFKESAQLGNIEAQLKLSAFYAQGVGVKADPVMSYVYIALAADHGHQQAKVLQSKIFQQLNQTQQQNANELWQTYQGQYGARMLQEDALPVLRKKRKSFSPIKRISESSTVSQQRYSAVHNYLTSVIFEFDIDVDGKVKDIEVEKNFYMSSFTKNNALNEMLKAKFRPAMFKTKNNKKKRVISYGHRSVWAQRTITDVYVKKNLPKFYRQLNNLRKSAEAGNAYDQYQLAMFYLVFPALEINQVNYVDYIKKSAEAGLPRAQLEYASLLLKGSKVTYNADKAINMLLTAAQSGNARAQYKLARHFYSGQILEISERKAHFWFKKAAAQDELYAKYWLARLYLTAKNKQHRNPEIAQALLLETADTQKNNPNWFYYSSLAAHQLGNNNDAEERLNEGLDLANSFEWNVKAFNKLAQKL